MPGSILMVSRNNLPLTKRAVASALAQDVECQVLVVDNLSSDGTIQWLKTKPVARIHYPYQKSLATCWNAGIRAFWAAGATEVLVINNDVELPPWAYRELWGQGKLFVTGVSVDSREKALRRLPNFYTVSPHPDMSCFMIRPEVTERVGWFDEDYFPAYCEDLSYHIRMHRAGIRAVSIDLPVYHERSSTLKNADPGEAARIRRGADINREKFRKQYGCLPGTPQYDALFA
jgi:GT2 family glycosyltransferase